MSSPLTYQLVDPTMERDGEQWRAKDGATRWA